MNKLELKEVLRKHQAWLVDRNNSEMANLSEAKLSGADLSEVNLRYAKLCDADLRDANLRRACLRDADLRYADLCEANLRRADLRWANLRGADLSGADLCEADLRGADLRGVNLLGATGFMLLPAQDPRGYNWPHAVLHDEWMIRAGCRFFTIEQAKQHWGVDYKGDREIGDMYLYAVDWLEAKIK